MAQPTFTALTEGVALNAATFNTALGSLVTQSTNIQAANLREQGIDRRPLTAASVVSLRLAAANGSAAPFSYGTAGGPNYNAAAWIQVQHGTALRLTNGGAGWTLNANTQIAVVRASLQIRRSYFDNYIGFRLFRSIAGVGAALPTSTRLFGFLGAVAAPWEMMEFTIVAQLWESGVYDWVELQTMASAGTFTNATEWYYLSEGNITLEVRDR